jgi:predicted RNA-binding Zn-ribbon protein involved in translation (DUF1610 family)
MKPTLDLTTYPGVVHEVKAAVLFACPYCGRGVTERNRLSYPAAVIGVYAPIYRCRCARYIGALLSGDEETDPS